MAFAPFPSAAALLLGLTLAVLPAMNASGQTPRSPEPDSSRPSPADTVRADSIGALPAMRVDLPAITVEAPQPVSPAVPDAARTTVLDSVAIARSGAASVDDLLSLRSGAFVKQYGASGLATASLRGTGASRTVVLLDGLRLSDPQSGQIDLSLLPTLLIESATVQHGAGSARSGSGSLGGTVRLQTLRASNRTTVRVRGGGGAFGERQGSAVVSGGSGRWSGLVAARRYASAGDFSYRNEFLFPPRSVEREGADIQTTTVYSRATWDGARDAAASAGPPAAPRWTVATWVTRSDRGLPGPASASSSDARQRDRLGRLWIDGTVPLGGGLLGGSTLDLQAQTHLSSLRYTNAITGTDRTSRTQSVDVTAGIGLPPTSTGTLEVGLSGGYDRASVNDGVDQFEAAATADGRLRAGPLLVEPALRLDATWLDGSTTLVPTPRLGVSLRPFEDERVVVKALLARAFRVPTFNERYYEPGGNPDLEPEDGWSADLGVRSRLSRPGWTVQAEVTGYTSRLTDQIVWRPSFVTNGVQVWRPGNVGAVRTWGLDLSMRGRVQVADAVGLRLGAVFTHTRAENRANRLSPAYGAQLPYVPPQQLKLWGGLAWNGLSVDLSGRLVGPRFYSSDESQRLAPYQVVDLRAGYRFSLAGANLTAHVQVDNLLDERYQVVRLYPMPPRHVSASVTVSLTP